MKCGMIIDEMFRLLLADDDPELQDQVWARMNYEYFEICGEYSWEKLRAPDPVELEFSEADDATGLWLPSDLLGIDMVYDSTNKLVFSERSKATAVENEFTWRYYTRFPSRANLYSGTDLVVEKGASSFTSAKLTAAGTAVDGEYVQFGEDPGFHLISSDTTPFTFTPSYEGDDLNADRFVIRPWANTRKMNIIDKAEAKITDKDVDVYYWRAPTPLRYKSDEILLPSSKILMLRTLRGMPKSKSTFPISQTMIDKAMRDAKGLSPDFAPLPGPYDKQGRRFNLANNIFGERAR